MTASGGAAEGPISGPVLGTLRTKLANEEKAQLRAVARASRWELRRGLWKITKLRRLARCGRFLTGEYTRVAKKDGTAYFLDVQTCGSVWSCPVCAAKIRQRRAVEIESACVQHLGAGGSIGFLTLTFPHSRGDDLANMLATLTLCWKDVQQGILKSGRARAKALGLFGFIRSTEITYGRWNGWHPHLHVLIFANRAVSESEWEELRDAISASWTAAVLKRGRERPGEVVGVTLGPVRKAEVGKYLAKVQDHYGHESTLGLEMARGDVKKGRLKSRTPFELAEEAVQGVAFEIGLWHDYESATYRRRAIEWSRGLKAGFDIEEVEDEELALADVDGDVFIPAVTKAQYALLVGSKAECTFLELGEAGGGVAAHEFLLRLQNERDREEEQRNE